MQCLLVQFYPYVRQVNKFVGRQIWPTKAQEVGIFVKSGFEY